MLQIEVAGLTKGEELALNQAHIDRLLLEQSRLAADFAKGDEWDDAGFNSPHDYIRFHCHVTSTTAANYLTVGGKLSQLSETVAAMDSQEVGFAHLVVMARTADAVGDLFDEGKLLALAKENTPGKLHYRCMHYRHGVDARSFDENHELLAQERHLTLRTTENGCVLVNGILDPVGGAAVRNALEPLAQPSGDFDERTRGQRFADAVVDVCTGGRPANIQVTASFETLKGLIGAAGAEMEFSLPISTTSVQGMACDCSLTRVLLSQESLPIDVSRSRRVISPTLRKALAIRDGHCKWPGCERPASWCDGHHLVHWINGGETNLDNLVLLCRRHHRMVHEERWQLIRTDEYEIVVIPPIHVFGLPRGPD